MGERIGQCRKREASVETMCANIYDAGGHGGDPASHNETPSSVKYCIGTMRTLSQVSSALDSPSFPPLLEAGDPPTFGIAMSLAGLAGEPDDPFPSPPDLGPRPAGFCT